MLAEPGADRFVTVSQAVSLLGVDLAETINQIRARVSMEVNGANSVFACEKHDGKGLA